MCMSGGGGGKSLRSGQLATAQRGVATSRVSGFDLQQAGWYNADGKQVKTRIDQDVKVKYSKGVKMVGRGGIIAKDGATRSFNVADKSKPLPAQSPVGGFSFHQGYENKKVVQTYRSAAWNPRMEANALNTTQVNDGVKARIKSRSARAGVANVNQNTRFSSKRPKTGSLRIDTTGAQVSG